jgi:hypothetical protein
MFDQPQVQLCARCAAALLQRVEAVTAVGGIPLCLSCARAREGVVGWLAAEETLAGLLRVSTVGNLAAAAP